jgi:ArsR family transcriptional regulator
LPVLATTPRDIELHAILLHGLSDRSRLRILEALRGGERRVGEIVAETELTQPNVSKHLACLWGCGLVAREKRGREIFYWLIPGVEELLSAVDQVLEKAGETVGACPLTEETLEPC